MPIESANYVNQLNPSNPAAPDLIADTDNHLRIIKQALTNTFPLLNGPVSLTPSQLSSYVPIGFIGMWSGAINAIPTGWALCNGQTVARTDGAGSITTPNLHEKFIKGCKADGTDMLTTGGSQALSGTTNASGGHSHTGYTDQQGAHAHGGITVAHALSVAEMPYHAHDATFVVQRGPGNTGAVFSSEVTYVQETRATSGAGGNVAHAHGVTADGVHAHNLVVSIAPDHTHTVIISDGRPPYYSLAYIMKV